MSQHPDTIGTIKHNGKDYEIDWPHRIDNETERESFGVIYLNGRPIIDFVKPGFGTFTNAGQVMQAARDIIRLNGVK